MTGKQPEALRLADRLTMSDYYEFDASLHCPQAAAELRRLHEQNAELLEALKTVTKHLGVESRNTPDLEAVWAAEKVIAKAEGDIDASC